MEPQQAPAATSFKGRPLLPGEAFVPHEVMQHRGLNGQRRGGYIVELEQAEEQAETGELNHDSHGAHRVEFQPPGGQGAHGNRSARYSILVCRAADQSSMSAIPAMPMAPPTSD